MKQFIDTCIFIYSASEDNEFKGSCLSVLKKIREKKIEAVTGVEVFQELVHFYRRKGLQEKGLEICWGALSLPISILPVTENDLRVYLSMLSKGRRNVQSRDFLHAAVMLNNGIERIITVDKDFDKIPGITRVGPAEV